MDRHGLSGHFCAADNRFMEKFCKKVDSLKMGLPWESGVKITPLAENDKAKYLNGLVTDAVEKGAKIANERGGKYDRTLYAPTILFPVKDGMKVYEEEQFGPVIPVTTFDDVEEVWADLLKSNYGQQAAGECSELFIPLTVVKSNLTISDLKMTNMRIRPFCLQFSAGAPIPLPNPLTF
mmetsp:Transcript_11951/g.49898  ORF Transcript_11951/g.49898 Transcript_11951/m.49898 type:complete len:179 (-) Transcript_11951:470-1006(-)